MAESSETAPGVSVFWDKTYLETVFLELNAKRQKQSMCDVYLKIQGCVERHGAHRIILACTCGYFQTGRLDDGAEEYHLPDDIEDKALNQVLKYLYTGKVRISFGNVKSILQAAAFLEISKVQKFCENFIMDGVTAKNALDFYRLARKIDLVELQMRLKKFILWNFSEIVCSDSYYTLSLEELQEIIPSDDLRMKSERHVYEALWKWYSHDTHNRKIFLEELMKDVRFSLLSQNYLETTVIPQLVESKNVSQTFAEENVTTFLDDKYQVKQQPRHSGEVVLVFSCKSNIVEKYNPVTQTFQSEDNLVPVKEHGESSDGGHHRVVQVQNVLYLVSEAMVQMFDPKLVKWNYLGPGVHVRDSTVCADEETFYVVGGKTCENRVMCYDVNCRTWTELPNLLMPRRYPAAVKKLNKLFVIGGFSQEKPSKEVERFSSKKWIQVNSLNQERFQAQAIALNNSIFVLGGRDLHGALDTVEVLTGRLKGWQLVKSGMLTPRTEFAAIAIDDRIWCFGGRGERTVECLDVEKGCSTYIGKMGSAYFDINAVTFPYI